MLGYCWYFSHGYAPLVRVGQGDTAPITCSFLGPSSKAQGPTGPRPKELGPLMAGVVSSTFHLIKAVANGSMIHFLTQGPKGLQALGPIASFGNAIRTRLGWWHFPKI